jgi:hypothetical protein
MADGYRNSAAADFSTLFDPDVKGDGPTASIFKKSDGTLLKYAKLSYGTKGPNVGFRDAAGVDLSNYWAAAGTARYGLPFDGGSFVARSSGLISGAMDANIMLSINSNGTYNLTCLGNSPDTTAGSSGSWLPTGDSASNYQVEFGWTQTFQFETGAATVTNGAATYQACTSNRSIAIDAQVGQNSGADKGSQGHVTVSLKKISTGQVTTSTFTVWVESFGSQ